MGIKITGTEIVNTSTTGDIVFKDSVGSEQFRFTKDGKLYKGGKTTDEFENIKSLSTQTLSWNGTNGVLTLSGGNSVDLDGRYATPADITAAINGLVDGAPTALNTLNELAAAIGDNDSYASTITTALGNKADVSHNHDSVYVKNSSLGIIGNNPTTVGSTAGWPMNPTGGTYTTAYSGHGGTVIMSADVAGSASSIGMEFTYDGRFYYHSNTDSNRWISHQVWTSANFANNSGNWNTAYSWGNHASAGYAAGNHTHTFASLTSKPTTLSGYGITDAASASHSHSEYLKYNPDGDGIAISYDDSNPTINGVSIGGGHWFGADGNTGNGYLAAKVLHAQGNTSSIGGYYVGSMNISAGGNSIAVIDGSGRWVGANLSESQVNFVSPSAPTLVSKATNGDGIQITFNQSNGQYYEIWSSVGNATDYALVGKVDPNSVAAQMTFIDSTMNTNSATIYYRIYAINKGVYGPPLEFSHSFSWTAPDIVPTSNVLMDLVIVTWEKPQSRLVKGFIVKLHSSSGTPSYASATQVANTTNTMFVYNVPRTQLDYNHEFWIEPVY